MYSYCVNCVLAYHSNGCVERKISLLKLIKTDRRTRLHHSTLSDLLENQVKCTSFSNFSPKQAVEAWWKNYNTPRRPNKSSRKQYAPWKSGNASTSTDQDIMEGSSGDQDSFAFVERDSWFDSDNDSCDESGSDE